MLLDLRRHLRATGAATLGEIAAHLDVEPATAEGLLEILVRRGDAICEPLAEHCTGCVGSCSGACSPQSFVLYRAARAAPPIA